MAFVIQSAWCWVAPGPVSRRAQPKNTPGKKSREFCPFRRGKDSGFSGDFGLCVGCCWQDTVATVGSRVACVRCTSSQPEPEPRDSAPCRCCHHRHRRREPRGLRHTPSAAAPFVRCCFDCGCCNNASAAPGPWWATGWSLPSFRRVGVASAAGDHTGGFSAGVSADSAQPLA